MVFLVHKSDVCIFIVFSEVAEAFYEDCLVMRTSVCVPDVSIMTAVFEFVFISVALHIVHPDFTASSLVMIHFPESLGFHAQFIACHSQFGFSETRRTDTAPASVLEHLQSSAEYVVSD